MGACASSQPADKYEVKGRAIEQQQEPSKPTSQPRPKKDVNASSSQRKSPNGTPSARKNNAAVPDFGLTASHEVLRMLGRGGEGETWLCREKETGHEVAIKLIKRPIPKPALAVIKREIKIQADLGQGHLNIVSASEVILTKSHLGLVMEYVPGGDMVTYVTKKRQSKGSGTRQGLCMDEDEARYYFQQLVSAVEYCHKNNVAHRDLKLDNTLLDQHSPPWLKLCDFGFAKHFHTNSNMDTMRIGTPEYMGPELISGRTGYDGKKVDVWAAGVLLFVMLAGMFPFEKQDDNFCSTAGLYDIWLQQIMTSWRGLPNNSTTVARLSLELQDLLDKMFDVKQDSRISIAGIKAHPWFNKPLPPKYAASLAELQREQAAIDDQVEQGAFQSSARNKALEVLIDRAAAMASPNEEVSRVNLTKLKRVYSLLVGSTMHQRNSVTEAIDAVLKAEQEKGTIANAC